MSRLNDHERSKKLLLKWYDRLQENKELLGLVDTLSPVESINLSEERANLLTNRFIVAICGQMNAGKSTLLNALLFQDEILPASPTTMTAKIAILSGGPEPHVEATLYTQEQFDQIVKAATGDEISKNELTRAREISRLKGLLEKDLLRTPPRVEFREGLKAIGTFVAVPEEGGVYTPYVEMVRLKADIPWLWQVEVADTPGTNDPNPQRDKITRNWISRADAVVYVTYAGQAGMTAEDVRFIDENLIHVDPRRRIIAVNKCDSHNDEAAVWSFLNGLKSTGNLRMQALFCEKENIVLVSGLGALIAEMQANGRQMSDTLSEWQHLIAARGFLDPSRHAIGKLRELIEDRIISGRGEAVIESHRSKVAAVFERIERRLAQQISELQTELAMLQASDEGREKEVALINQAIESVADTIRNTRNAVERDVEKSVEEASEKLNKIGQKCLKSLHVKLLEVKNLDGLPKQAQWAVRQVISETRGDVVNSIFEALPKVELILNVAETDLSNRILSLGLDARAPFVHILPISPRSITKEIEEQLHSSIDLKYLGGAVHEACDFIDRWFNTNTGRKKGVDALAATVGPNILACFEMIQLSTRASFRKATEEAIEQMGTSVQNLLVSRLKKLEALEDGGKSIDEERARVGKACGEAAGRLTEIGKLREDFESSMK